GAERFVATSPHQRHQLLIGAQPQQCRIRGKPSEARRRL
ncbi:MAG: hypothetical protein AVDCRST_MAG65-1728, partial [uncultured Solirubrobacteraceae bacterium]